MLVYKHRLQSFAHYVSWFKIDITITSNPLTTWEFQAKNDGRMSVFAWLSWSGPVHILLFQTESSTITITP